MIVIPVMTLKKKALIYLMFLKPLKLKQYIGSFSLIKYKDVKC